MQGRAKTALLALSAVAVSLPAMAQSPADRPEYWHYGGEWGVGHIAFGGLMMLLFWGAIIALIVLVVRWLGGSSPGGGQPPRNRALDLLEERFAQGEIDREEFEERRRLLSARAGG